MGKSTTRWVMPTSEPWRVTGHLILDGWFDAEFWAAEKRFAYCLENNGSLPWILFWNFYRENRGCVRWSLMDSGTRPAPAHLLWGDLSSSFPDTVLLCSILGKLLKIPHWEHDYMRGKISTGTSRMIPYKTIIPPVRKWSISPQSHTQRLIQCLF